MKGKKILHGEHTFLISVVLIFLFLAGIAVGSLNADAEDFQSQTANAKVDDQEVVLITADFDELTALVPNCSISSSTSQFCRTAIHRYCTKISPHFVTGAGPLEIDYAARKVLLVCFTRKAASIVKTNMEELKNEHSLCWSPGVLHSLSCNAAIDRICKQKVGADSYSLGCLEIAGNTIYVGCTKGEIGRGESTLWHNLALENSQCTGPNSFATGACRSAVSRYCQKKGFITGIGPVETGKLSTCFQCLRAYLLKEKIYDTLDYFLPGPKNEYQIYHHKGHQSHPFAFQVRPHPVCDEIGYLLGFKFNKPNLYVAYRWDHEYIYWYADHSLDEMDPNGIPTGGYKYVIYPDDAYWLKRKMKIGESIEVDVEWLPYIDMDTCEYEGPLKWSYVVKLEDVRVIDWQGDVGPRETMVWLYSYPAPLGGINSEREFFAKGWGLVCWQWLDGNGNIHQLCPPPAPGKPGGPCNMIFNLIDKNYPPEMHNPEIGETCGVYYPPNKRK